MIALLVSLWLCLAPAARAARWTEPQPLEAELDGSGALELPAGEVVHLTPSRPDATIEVVDRRGHPVRLVAHDGGLLVAAHYLGRSLVVLRPPDVTVTVMRPSDRGQAVAWEQWEAGVWRALRSGIALPEGPEGSTSVGRNAEARRAAGVSATLVGEGFLAESTLARPVARHAFEPLVLLASGDGRPRTVTVEGPARVRIETEWTEGDGLQDGWLVWRLGEGSDRWVPLRAAAGTRRGIKLYVPPGAHRLSLEVKGSAARVDVVTWRLRPSMSWPAVGAAADTAVDAAERAYLAGDHEAALAGWEALVDAPGARGWLARARVLELSPSLAGLEALARLESDAAGPAAELLAAQIVARGAALAPESVLAALARTADPDLFDLAAFLDAYSVHRPLGTGALQSAFPVVAVDPSVGWETASFLSRRSSLRTLVPDGAGVPVVRLDGPGIERRLVTPEAGVSVRVPPGPLGRAAVLRLRCDAACAFEVRGSDGRVWAYDGAAGRYDTALPTGPAAVAVRSGAVVVLDPELVEGGTYAVERLGAALPASWDIPGGGVPVELRLDASPDGSPVIASFDDGSVLRVTGRRLIAPAGATRVHMEGVGVRSLAMRVRHTIAAPEVDSTSTSCEQASLDALEDRSRRIEAGEAGLDLERGRILGCLGLASLARADLADALVSGDPARTAAAEALERWLKTTLPDAPVPGPTSLHGTLALVGEAPARDAQELERVAEAHPGHPHLQREVARAWMLAAEASPDPSEQARLRLHALTAAWAADGAADDLLSGLEARMDWRDVSLAETSAGVPEAVIRARRARVVSPLGRAAAAMMAWPWPAEHALTLRDDGGERIRVPAGASARVDVACRDVEQAGRDCRVALRATGPVIGSTTWTETVEVGPPTTLALPDGMQELELRGPGKGLRMSVRLQVDGELMPPVSVRRVLRARPGEPVRLTVASPTAVSVASIDGTPLHVVATEVAVGGQGGDPHAPETVGPVRVDGAPSVVPVPPTLVLADGKGQLWDLRVEGDGRVQVQLGVPRPADDEEAVEAPVGPESDAWLPEALDQEVLDEVLGRFRFPTAAVGPGPSPGGTWELDLTVGRDQQFAPTEPWEVGEVEVFRYGRRDALWGAGSAWLRGPTGATGVTAEGGLRLAHGWTGVRARAGAGRDIAASRAGSVDLRAFVVRDTSLQPDLRLRWDALVDGRWSSEPPLVRVDPRAWTPYRVDHPVFLEGGLGLVSEPKRELRLDVSLRGRSNTAASLDRLMLQAGVDRLLLPRTLVSGNAELVARFADAHRAGSDLSPRARIRLQHAVVQQPSTHVRLWSEAWSMPLGGAWEAWVGVRLIRSPGRGLRDLPPHREVFRSAMEGP